LIPIRVRQFPAFLKSAVQRAQVLQKADPGGRVFHLCFFSCESYFRYLYCSLHSLTHNLGAHSVKVLVFSDTDQPLTDPQIAAIQALIPGARVIPWPKSMGWGAEQIGWIWKAYGLAAEGAKDDDIIARVDSDVFFFNDTIFKAVARSGADLVGDGHYVGLQYSQGGCYFWRASAVRKVNAMIASDGMERILSEIGIQVEDIAATHFARRLKLKVWLTWFMMFPDELKNAGGLTPWSRWKFSCVHFVMKNKAAMLDAYEREVFGGQSPAPYREALKVH
jgi:hypothetical protein